MFKTRIRSLVLSVAIGLAALLALPAAANAADLTPGPSVQTVTSFDSSEWDVWLRAGERFSATLLAMPGSDYELRAKGPDVNVWSDLDNDIAPYPEAISFVAPTEDLYRITAETYDYEDHAASQLMLSYSSMEEPVVMSVSQLPIVSYGAATKLSGAVTMFGYGLASRPVSIKRVYGEGWQPVANTATGSTGAFSYTVRPTVNKLFSVTMTDPKSGLPEVYRWIPVYVRAYLTLDRLPSTWKRGVALPVSGYIKPARGSENRYSVQVYAYHYEGGRWVLRRQAGPRDTDYSSYTRYAGTIKLLYTGRWKLVTVFDGNHMNVRTVSAPRYVTVK